MNNIKEYQKAIKKEKVEKIVNALNKNLIDFGYFLIVTKEKTVIYGQNYQINDKAKEPFVLVYDKNNKIYANIKIESIIYISLLDFNFK